eukprot:gene44767-26468_t
MLFCGSKDGCKPVGRQRDVPVRTTVCTPTHPMRAREGGANDFTVSGETNVNRNFIQPKASLSTCLK